MSQLTTFQLRNIIIHICDIKDCKLGFNPQRRFTFFKLFRRKFPLHPVESYGNLPRGMCMRRCCHSCTHSVRRTCNQVLCMSLHLMMRSQIRKYHEHPRKKVHDRSSRMWNEPFDNYISLFESVSPAPILACLPMKTGKLSNHIDNHNWKLPRK